MSSLFADLNITSSSAADSQHSPHYVQPRMLSEQKEFEPVDTDPVVTAERLERFIDYFELRCISTRCTDQREKLVEFILAGGDEFVDIYKSSVEDVNMDDPYNSFVNIVKQRYLSKEYQYAGLAEFYRIRQGKNEDFFSFLAKLQKAARRGPFETRKEREEQIKRHITVYCRDIKIKRCNSI